jgi:hypothetical protein
MDDILNVRPNAIGTAVHELGHNMGLDHERGVSLLPGGRMEIGEYGGWSSVMGQGASSFSPYEMYWSRWISPSNIQFQDLPRKNHSVTVAIRFSDLLRSRNPLKDTDTIAVAFALPTVPYSFPKGMDNVYPGTYNHYMVFAKTSDPLFLRNPGSPEPTQPYVAVELVSSGMYSSPVALYTSNYKPFMSRPGAVIRGIQNDLIFSFVSSNGTHALVSVERA